MKDKVITHTKFPGRPATMKITGCSMFLDNGKKIRLSCETCRLAKCAALPALFAMSSYPPERKEGG